MNNNQIYDMVTERVTAALEKGVVPWQRPWDPMAGAPRSLATGKVYRGINLLLLGLTAQVNGYSSPWWATYRAIKAKGGQVRKGETGTPICKWNIREVKKVVNGVEKIEKIPFLRYWTVFNADQADDLDTPEARSTGDFDPVFEAEQTLLDYAGGRDGSGPALTFGGTAAFYDPLRDLIALPDRKAFTSPDGFYNAAFHEAAHSTGHKTRLDREKVGHCTFGTPDYAREELIAQMAAAFISGSLGLDPQIENSAAYIQSWLKALKDDRALVLVAAGKAQKAADLVLGDRAQDQGSADTNGEAVAA